MRLCFLENDLTLLDTIERCEIGELIRIVSLLRSSRCYDLGAATSLGRSNCNVCRSFSYN